MAVAVDALKVNTNVERISEDDDPVSPTGQYFNSSALSIHVLAIFESEIPIDDSPTFWMLENTFLPLHQRFSSIMVRDEHGVQQWKKVEVNLQDHVNLPTFPSGFAPYDEHVKQYLTKISMEKLPMSRPLWDLHIIKYPTKNAQGTMVFKLHHALGDGFSLMGALLSCVKRADNPSLPLTFPTSKAKLVVKENAWQMVTRALSTCVNTLKDFGWSLMKSNFIRDDRTALRSGDVGVEFRPIEISTITFSLEQIRQIKDKLGGTINDVMTGIIFYGTQLYLEASGPCMKASPHVTALVLLNTRIIANYQHLNEMTRPNAKAPWGNQFGFLHVSVPIACRQEQHCDPLSFVTRARQIIKNKRSSLAVYLTGTLLETLRKITGPEYTAKYLHSTLSHTTMTVSNLTGPIEQMIIAGHPVRNLYFMVVGVPQSLTVTVVSYMGQLTVSIGSEKGFVNSQLLMSCMEKSFNKIFEAAVNGSNN